MNTQTIIDNIDINNQYEHIILESIQQFDGDSWKAEYYANGEYIGYSYMSIEFI